MVAVIFCTETSHHVTAIMVYHTNSGHPASMNPIRRTNLLSNIDVVTLSKFCTNFKVFAHFVLQSSPTKLYSCKNFPEITPQYLIFASFFLHVKHFEVFALL